jgi:hypothetical protein
LVNDIPAGDGKIGSVFLQCTPCKGALLWNADERTSKKEIILLRKGKGKADNSNFATNFFFKSSEEGKVHQ